MFKKLKNKVNALACRAKAELECRKAEAYVDTGVKILIAVVIGTLLLSLLYTLVDHTIMLNASNRIKALFNYSPGGPRG